MRKRQVTKMSDFKIWTDPFSTFQQETRTSAEEMRSYQKEKGVVPPRPWNERPLTMTHSNAIFDPYVPSKFVNVVKYLFVLTFVIAEEKEDKASLVSSEGVKEFYTDKAKKTTSYKALRKNQNLHWWLRSQDILQSATPVIFMLKFTKWYVSYPIARITRIWRFKIKYSIM